MGETFSFNRYRGLIPVVVSLVLSSLFVNFCLLALTGPAPTAFTTREVYWDWRDFEKAADRVEAIPSNDPFILYTGLSTAMEGIEPGVLASKSGCGLPVAGVCSAGGSMAQFRELQYAVFDRNLHPSMVILCIHATWLAGEYDDLPPDSLNPLLVNPRDWRGGVRAASWWNWISKNRYYVNHLMFDLLYRGRVLLGTATPMDPWSPEKRLGLTTGTPPKEWEPYGWFDERRYQKVQQWQIADLGAIISAYRSRGTDVRVAIMPVGTVYRTRVPVEARQLLLTYLTREFPTVPVLNFESAMPDNDFVDQIHLNDQGRAAFTPILARAIAMCAKSPRSNLLHE